MSIPSSLNFNLLNSFSNGNIHISCWKTLLCGLIGIPPANGVIPQSPMHTKSLATLKHQVRQVKNVSYSQFLPD